MQNFDSNLISDENEDGRISLGAFTSNHILPTAALSRHLVACQVNSPTHIALTTYQRELVTTVSLFTQYTLSCELKGTPGISYLDNPNTAFSAAGSNHPYRCHMNVHIH